MILQNIRRFSKLCLQKSDFSEVNNMKPAGIKDAPHNAALAESALEDAPAWSDAGTHLLLELEREVRQPCKIKPPSAPAPGETMAGRAR
jgi:hypothetical protein